MYSHSDHNKGTVIYSYTHWITFIHLVCNFVYSFTNFIEQTHHSSTTESRRIGCFRKFRIYTKLYIAFTISKDVILRQ